MPLEAWKVTPKKYRFCEYLVLVHIERTYFGMLNISLITFIEEYLCSGWKDHLSHRGDDWPMVKLGSVFAACKVGGKDGCCFAWSLSKPKDELWVACRCGHQRKGSVPGVQILNDTVSSAAQFLLFCLVAGKWLSISKSHVLHQLHLWVRASWS